MKKIKVFLILFMLILTYASFLGLAINVKGDTYSIPVGTEWTVRMESSTLDGNMTYKITSSTGTVLRGDAREIYDNGQCRELLNQDLSSQIYSREQVDGTIAPASTLKNVTYAGKTVEAWVCTSLPGYDYVAVVNATGIILNITTTSQKLWLISWNYEECSPPPPGIPGYEISILLGSIALSIFGIIIYIRKTRI